MWEERRGWRWMEREGASAGREWRGDGEKYAETEREDPGQGGKEGWERGMRFRRMEDVREHAGGTKHVDRGGVERENQESGSRQGGGQATCRKLCHPPLALVGESRSYAGLKSANDCSWYFSPSEPASALPRAVKSTTATRAAAERERASHLWREQMVP